ncbi:DUF1858 domain-containing protein [Neofamilia massiliensis]|uniref:DUF1858 domain-containing protein n=1 Tax=Neofamilia massiliensis TaxID=1673724 RepID=UPI0006BB8963|nr:DUF1858 domain-containing protein [Neofamilia massiliensis]
MTYTKDMLIGDVVRQNPETIGILMSFGMGCVGCPSSQMESLEEAAMVHGLDLEHLMEALNELDK